MYVIVNHSCSVPTLFNVKYYLSCCKEKPNVDYQLTTHQSKHTGTHLMLFDNIFFWKNLGTSPASLLLVRSFASYGYFPLLFTDSSPRSTRANVLPLHTFQFSQPFFHSSVVVELTVWAWRRTQIIKESLKIGHSLCSTGDTAMHGSLSAKSCLCSSHCPRRTQYLGTSHSSFFRDFSNSFFHFSE